MKIPRLVTVLAVLALSLMALGFGKGPPPDAQQKQAQKQLKTAVKVMTKEQAQQQAQALQSFKVCLEAMRDDIESGLPPELLLPSLRDCLAEFVDHLAAAEGQCRSGLMQQAGELLGPLDGTPPGFLRGDGGHQDKAVDKFHERSRKRLEQGLKLVDKTLDKAFLERGYAFNVRAIVPDMDEMVPVRDDLLEDLRPHPIVAVMVAGSSLNLEGDGLLFVAGYGYDPDKLPPKDTTPSMDSVQFVCRDGTATQVDVPLTALDPGEPVGPDNPAIKWSTGFNQLDEPGLLMAALPEGNGLVRAEQNGVIGVATIGIP